jgi:hypothetical protein
VPTPGQAVPSVTASAGGVEIRLWDGRTGDFRLTGNLARSWTDPFAGGSAFNAQVRLLTLPGGIIPEPGTWAMMAAGSGLAGAAMRRPRPALA